MTFYLFVGSSGFTIDAKEVLKFDNLFDYFLSTVHSIFLFFNQIFWLEVHLMYIYILRKSIFRSFDPFQRER